MQARGYLQLRANLVEREVRPDAVPRLEEGEVLARGVAADVVESCLPERRLPLEIVDAQHDRADAEHRSLLYRRAWECLGEDIDRPRGHEHDDHERHDRLDA